MSGHEERTHRRYSPSKADRIALCPGSDRLVLTVSARPPSTYAVEGTKAHVVLEAALKNQQRRARIAHQDHSYLCMEELDENYGGPYRDFYYSIQVALDYVWGILDKHPDAVLFLETYVNPPSVEAPGEVGGHCDIAIYVPSLSLLYIIDYKHGAGITKSVVGNRQVYQYAAGFLYDPESPIASLMPGGDAAEFFGERVRRVILAITQPRAFHIDGEIREIEETPYGIYEYLDRMDEAIRKAKEYDAPLIPGDEQCRFCAAAAQCPAREAKALALVNTQFATVRNIERPGIPDPKLMEVETLERTALALPVLEDWITAVRKRLFELAQQGAPLKHHKVVEALARRKWYGDPDDIAVKLAALIGCKPDDVMVKKLINITDADKRVKAAFRDRAPRGEKKQAAEDATVALAMLTLKESSGALTLVGLDDDRPAVDRARVVMQQIGELLPGIPLTGDD